MNTRHVPDSIRLDRPDAHVLLLTLTRAQKRNALDDRTIQGLGTIFETLPADVRVVVMQGEGDHFSAGLDLSELTQRDVVDGIAHSRMWHRVFDGIQFGKVPVIAVMHGAVVGGGLELACTAHVRVAEKSAFYALPEGQRGIFVGGGATVRLPRLIGVSRMTDMMLTGRTYDAEAGQAIGLSHYLVETGQGLPTALQLAAKVSSNAPMTNFAVMHALPRIAEAGADAGYFTESLMSAVAQSTDEAKQRIQDFLAARAGERTPPK